MNYPIFQRLSEKLYFTIEDIVGLLSIKPASAHVFCNRYVKEGIFVRLKNNFYVLDQNVRKGRREDLLKIANFLQVPSYISFMTALMQYGITTQVQQGYFENASLKRTFSVIKGDVAFKFYKLQKKYYSGFGVRKGLFIASPEKAFIDCLYLSSMGKYTFDTASLDLRKLDKKKIKKLLQGYPKKTRNMAGKVCKI